MRGLENKLTLLDCIPKLFPTASTSTHWFLVTAYPGSTICAIVEPRADSRQSKLELGVVSLTLLTLNPNQNSMPTDH